MTSSSQQSSSQAPAGVNRPRPPASVSPIVQFISLLAPFVMTGFFLVYALVGLILEGDSLMRWCDEALEVGLFVLLIIAGLNLPVMAYAYFKRLPIRHVLWISPIGHIAIAIVLTLIIGGASACYV